MSDLPEPPVPTECDLRDFAFMPLDVRRLLTSETWLLGSAEEKCAAMALWCEAWHQVPAASVPDNDRMLAHLSQAGSRWAKVKAHVLRSWIKCSDGRLYHPVVAEKAIESWAKKEMQRDRSRKANLARWGRNGAPSANRVRDTDGRVLDARMEESGGPSEDEPSGAERTLQEVHKGQHQAVHKVIHDASHKESSDDPKGQGQGQGQGQGERKDRKPEPSESPTPAAKQRSFGEALLVRYALGPAPNQPLAEAPPDEQTFAWPLILSVQGKIVPAEVPPEWIGETYRTHPLVDGYAASEAFGEYWTEGKGAGTTRTERGWHQCWRSWIAREKPQRTAEWINRYGYSKHLHGSIVEQPQHQPSAA